MEIERRGIPTVSIVASSFSREAAIMARSMGLDTLRQLVVERALTDMPPDDVREALAGQADKVERLLTEPVSRPRI
ncbi:MAG: hypothetical protein AAB502_05945, partial [Chloroflexota bacterium]